MEVPKASKSVLTLKYGQCCKVVHEKRKKNLTKVKLVTVINTPVYK